MIIFEMMASEDLRASIVVLELSMIADKLPPTRWFIHCAIRALVFGHDQQMPINLGGVGVC